MPVDDRDDLFTPSVRTGPAAGEPYHGSSLIYPAFFGGPLALLPFARRSAEQLNLPDQDVLRVTLVCLGSLLAVAVAAVVLVRNGLSERAPRLAVQAGGLLAYAVVTRMMRGAQRRHELRQGAFAKLSFWVGLAACIGLGIAQALVLALVLAVFT